MPTLANSVLGEKHLTVMKNWSSENAHEFMNNDIIEDITVVSFYSVMILIAVFGNLLVCQVVFRYPAIKYSSNKFIGNLSLANLLMSIYSLPLNVARMIMDNWTLGHFLCSSSTFIQHVSVYVSTLTMTCIAYDRYKVINNPLSPLLRNNYAKWKIAFIWFCAIIMSLPYALFTNVEESFFTYRNLDRCQIIYPEPSTLIRMWGTIAVFITQYVIPLGITATLYARIVYILWYRKIIGSITERQRLSLQRGKWKTIKISMLVVAVFAICWLPINLYNLYMDSAADSPYKREPNVFLLCQCIAMSSICYNPFIYCGFNHRFHELAISYIRRVRGFFNNCCKSINSRSVAFRRSSNVNQSDHSTRYSREFTQVSMGSIEHSNPISSIGIAHKSYKAQPSLVTVSERHEIGPSEERIFSTTESETCV